MTDEEAAAFDAETVELHGYLTLAVEYMDVRMQTEAIRPDGTVKRYSIDDTTWHRVLAIARGSLSDDARRVLTADWDALLARAALRAATPDPAEPDHCPECAGGFYCPGVVR